MVTRSSASTDGELSSPKSAWLTRPRAGRVESHGKPTRPMACRHDVNIEINDGPTRTTRPPDSVAPILGEPARDARVTVPPMAQKAAFVIRRAALQATTHCAKTPGRW